MKEVILAAGIGRRLGDSIPKALVQIGQTTLIHYSLMGLKKNGIQDIVIVTGYQGTLLEKKIGDPPVGLTVKYAKNPLHASSGTLYSLWCGCKDMDEDDFLLVDADLLYDPRFVTTALESPYPDLFMLGKPLGNGDDYFITFDSHHNIQTAGTQPVDPSEKRMGVFFGIVKFSRSFVKKLFDHAPRERKLSVGYHDCILDSELRGRIRVVPAMNLEWCEVDTPYDLQRAREEFFPKLRHQFLPLM